MGTDDAMSGEHPKVARTDHEVHELIRRRWSPRAFDPAREVARQDLLKLFEAARWTPSSFNQQPWHFVVTDRRRTPEAFDALFRALTGRNPAWAGSAPMLVLVVVRASHQAPGAGTAHAWYDTGQAVANLTLQATAEGVSIRQMQGFDPERARSACGVPEGFVPAVVMAIGYAGEPSALEGEQHREAEQQPRVRRPIAAFVFEGSWGRGLAED
jgi:nitroreductase